MLIRTRLQDAVGTITLDHPARRNAISRALVDEVLEALDAFRGQGARAVVLRAADGVSVWSAGHDVDELESMSDPLASSATLDRLLEGVTTFPAPVIAMVHGSVWGGATDLVLSCDLVVGDTSCSFAMPALNLGVAYDLEGLRRFARRLPLVRVKELFYTARPVAGEEALAWGIVNHLVPEAELERYTYELATGIAAKAPLAVAAVKEQLRVLARGELVSAEIQQQIDALRRRAQQSSDLYEGIRAFRDKRPPRFRGQ